MNILIIDQCSGDKSYPDSSKVYTAGEIDSRTIEDLLDQQNAVGIPARKLYAGRQQEFITEAVNELRRAQHDVDRYFISAGFGLVEADRKLPPYDVTFSSMADKRIRDRAIHLNLTEDVRNLIATNYHDVIFFALGGDYCHALDLSEVLSALRDDATVVLFNQENQAERFDNVISIPARNPQAKEQETIVVALKGKYLQNFAVHLTGEIVSQEDLVDYCTRVDTTQSEFEEYS